MAFKFKSTGNSVGDWSKVSADQYSNRAKVGILNQREPDSYEAPKPVQGADLKKG
jgi:hypothetical protein|tara:strand:- start:5639 stop:5803 length:165 start_codon:yes stop_codon:yes gene_type:complete